jgi:hypothetical protein
LYCLSFFFSPLYCLSFFFSPLYCLSFYNLRLSDYPFGILKLFFMSRWANHYWSKNIKIENKYDWYQIGSNKLNYDVFSLRTYVWIPVEESQHVLSSLFLVLYLTILWSRKLLRFTKHCKNVRI